MRRINALIRLCRYGFASQRPKSPLVVTFAVTSRCDMKCRHCGDDVWGDPSKDLSISEIEKLSQSIGPFKDLAIGGGEPFLRKDIQEICKLFSCNNKVENIGIATNGYAVERICLEVEKIIISCPNSFIGIGVSLDGFQQTHDSIRMPGSFERAMDTAQRFTYLRKKYNNFNFFFNATINNVNWSELPDLAAHVHEKFHTFLDFNVLTGNPRDFLLRSPGEDDLRATIDGIYSIRKNYSIPESLLNIYRDSILNNDKRKLEFIPCRAGSLLSLIEANGNVRACPQFPVLGNLRNQPFSEIWQSDLTKKVFGKIINDKCSCSDSCYLISSINHSVKLPMVLLKQKIKKRI